MNYKTIKYAALLLAISFTSARAGIVILAEVPEGIKQLLEKAREVARARVEDHNAQKDIEKKYIFDAGKYTPHISLAYVSDKELSMEELKNAEPALQNSIEDFAKSNQPVDMGYSLKESHLIIWDGREEQEHEGKIYKNYSILVIKVKPSKDLTTLVDKLDQVLEKHEIAMKRKFPFSPHVTIGWIYDENDVDSKPMAEKVKPALEKCIVEYQMPEDNFSIEAIKLSAHDKKQQIIELGK